MNEAWSTAERRKRAKKCNNPKGFTMKQFCKNQKTKSKPGEKTNESIRRLVREMLVLESSPPPGFTSSTTHSVGWISPDGQYFYDPNKPDHGEWAAFQVERDPDLMAKFLVNLKKATDPIDPPPPRTPAEQARYDAMSDWRKKSDDWQRQGGRSLKGKPIPAYNNMEELYYSDIQTEVRSSALKTLLQNGWGKVSNAYSMECWKPTRTVVNAWLDLGMQAGSDSERYHNIFDDKKSLVEGDWTSIERFVRRLP